MYEFLCKHKVIVEKLNYFQWAKFLEKVTTGDKTTLLLSKIDESAKRNNLSYYRQILFEEFENTCFYCGKKLYSQADVDHFIPWSFVMNDELWNLMPMDSALNSAKNNKLPDWNDFFIRFARNQYIMYEMIHEREGIRKLYEACYRDNLHSIWANQELYRKGNSDIEFYGILEKNMRPVYDSARRQGYDVWDKRLVV